VDGWIFADCLVGSIGKCSVKVAKRVQRMLSKSSLSALLEEIQPLKDESAQNLLSRSLQFSKSPPSKHNWLKKMKLDDEKVLHLASESRPILHEKTLLLLEEFIQWKRENGTKQEKSLYKGMGILGLVQRLIANVRKDGYDP